MSTNEYKIAYESNLHEKWQLYNAHTLEKTIIKNFNPKNYKIFNFDVFEYDEHKNGINILHSIVKNMSRICGILVLKNNKTYGKTKNNKFYYKCIPDDKRISHFLIPYKEKQIGFSKHFTNKYIVFKFEHWDEKHPHGILTNVIGDVGKLENFYEYQLYVKSLYSSIQDFTKATNLKLRQISQETFVQTAFEKYKIDDRRDCDNIYTIDPKGSKDFDDAFSYVEKHEHHVVSIYISNVPIWMNLMELWDSFSQRIATIYLPDRKRPMLPAILSDVLCSLQENETRFAFCIDIYIDKSTFKIKESRFSNTCIRVKKNYRYNDDLSSIGDITNLRKILKKTNKITTYSDNIKDNHDIIAYMMVLMNFICANKMVKYNCGIFRSLKFDEQLEIPETFPDEVKVFMKVWKSNGSRYVSFENEEKSHEMLKLNEYIHITSPIRRIVDMLNILEIQDKMGIMKFTKESRRFHTHWTNKGQLEYINQTIQSIRRIQSECELLSKCVNYPNITNAQYDGYIFDVMERNDGLFQYIVFLNKLNIMNKFISYKKLEKYSKQKFKVFLIEEFDTLKQKVRFEVISD